MVRGVRGIGVWSVRYGHLCGLMPAAKASATITWSPSNGYLEREMQVTCLWNEWGCP